MWLVPAFSQTTDERPAPSEPVTDAVRHAALASNVPQTTWEPPASQEHGKLTAARLRELPASAYAFPRVRREPLTDAAHVRSAIARFRQVKHVTDEEREVAFANIQKAAKYFGIRMKAATWQQLISREETGK